MKKEIHKLFSHHPFLLAEIKRENKKTLEKTFFESREFLITIREWKSEDDILVKNLMKQFPSLSKELVSSSFYTKV